VTEIQEIGLEIVHGKIPKSKSGMEYLKEDVEKFLRSPGAMKELKVGDRFIMRKYENYWVFEVKYVKPEGETKLGPWPYVRFVI